MRRREEGGKGREREKKGGVHAKWGKLDCDDEEERERVVERRLVQRAG